VGVKPLAWHEMVRGFRNLGFEGPFYGKGKSPHPFMKRENHKIPIPNDHGETIGAPLVRRVIRIVGITDEEWEEATK
jgi:hypothetical protein